MKATLQSLGPRATRLPCINPTIDNGRNILGEKPNGDRALLLCYRAGSPPHSGFHAAIRCKPTDALDPQWLTLVHRLDSERPIRPAMKRHYGFRPSLAHQTDALGEREHGRTRDDATLGEGLHQTVLKHPALGKAKSEEAA